jgi:hypothetical protein
MPSKEFCHHEDWSGNCFCIEAIMRAEKESDLTPALPDKIPDR